MKTFFYYLTLSFQLFGLIAVGICFLTGVNQGDYGKIELVEFVLGSTLFYLSHIIRSKFLRT